jgi:hypothetical protein
MNENKQALLNLMKGMGFDIHDVSYEAGCELVAKECDDGSIVWWPLETEGNGFQSLFQNSIRRIFEQDDI